MTQSLQVDRQLVVGRERVRELLKRCDPEGIALKSKHRLKRRQCVNKRPNYLWHMDGYDVMGSADVLCSWRCPGHATTPALWLGITLIVLSN